MSLTEGVTSVQDPGISNTQPAGQYPPFDDGVKQDIFIKNSTGGILIGKVSLLMSLDESAFQRTNSEL